MVNDIDKLRYDMAKIRFCSETGILLSNDDSIDLNL